MSVKFNALVPELRVKDIDVTNKFYIDILGFVMDYERPKDKFIFVSLGNAQIMLMQVTGNWETGRLEYPLGRGINFQIICDDIGLIYENLTKVKWPIYAEMSVTNYRENNKTHQVKEFLVQDPDGYLLRFQQDL